MLGDAHSKLLNTPISSVIGTEISSNILKLEDILLTGKFDILLTTDLDKKYRVADYKTGEPKSKNWVIGQTKDSDGDYFNQLKFYKLLGSLMPEKFDITEGSILFVQEIEKSVHLPLTNEDSEDIKQKIRTVHSSIMEANFHPVSENQSADSCERCEYKRICAVGV